MKLTVGKCQLVLTLLWWGWGVLLILALAVLSSQPKIFSDASAAWGWFLPNLTPTMMLVGAAAYTKQKTSDLRAETIGPLFLISLLVSIVYLLLLTGSIVGVLFSSQPIDWLGKSSLWLGPMQGLAASSLGAFFSK